jgi:hypothetical protein
MPKLRINSVAQYDARLFLFILYSEGAYPWIRREKNRFSIHLRSIHEHTHRRNADLKLTFNRMMANGWIYFLEFKPTNIEFYVQMPSWAAFSDVESESADHVPTHRLDVGGTWGLNPYLPRQIKDPIIILPNVKVDE